MSRLARDETAEPSRETKFSGANADREIFIFPVQLTMSRIGNLNPVDPYPCYMCDHTYIHTIQYCQLTTSRIVNLTRLVLTLAICVTIQSRLLSIWSKGSLMNRSAIGRCHRL